MKRTTIFLTEKQIVTIKRISKDTGLAMADLIRRALDRFVDDHKAKGR